jgi:undecaprenyl-diphosphatase
VTTLHAAVLGLVQGLTEFLPVSSSGHLILIPELLGWDIQSATFDAVLHLATLGAILVAFKDDVWQLVSSVVSDPHGRRTETGKWSRLAWTIVVATIPAVAAGVLFKVQIETTLRNPLVVVISLVFWAIVLWVVDASTKPTAQQDVVRVSSQQGVFIGLAQALALIPGTSRSGITITAGLATGLSRAAAARFAFLLGIPSVAGAGALAMTDLFGSPEQIEWVPLTVGFLAAFISGLFAIRFLLRLLKTASFRTFVYYRIALAVVIAIVFLK